MNISEKAMKLIYLISAIFIAVIIFIWLTGFPFTSAQEFEASLFQSILIVGMLALSSFALLYLSIIYKISTSTGKIWVSLGLGMLLWTIGEIIYSYYNLYTEIAPFPSIADLFYLVGYIPLAIGLILQMKLTKINLSIKEKITILIFFAIICILVIITVIIIPYWGYEIPAEETFAFIIAALYPLSDLLLLLCIFVAFAKLRHGKINTAWILILFGFLLNTIADILFNWSENVELESMLFEIYDLLFLIGYFLIFIGALNVISIMTKTFEKKPQSS